MTRLGTLAAIRACVATKNPPGAPGLLAWLDGELEAARAVSRPAPEPDVIPAPIDHPAPDDPWKDYQ